MNDIFRRRFEKANVLQGKTLKDVLGASEYKGGSVASEIAYRHAKKKLRGLKFHGVDTIVQLCTGDISSIIDLLGNLFRKQKQYDEEAPIVKAKSKQELPITATKQNAAIRLYARREIMKLLDIRQFDGRHLFEIAVRFGQMSRNKILTYSRGPLYKEGERAPEYLRIEVEQNINLPKAEDEKLRALLQHGIFVDGGLGAAYNGTPTQVLIFRKLFCPVFPTGLTSQNSFSWSAATFSRFLRNPRSMGYEEGNKSSEKDLFYPLEEEGAELGGSDRLDGA
jgi:hypothetical protein